MTVKLTDGVEWINECYPHGDMHEHVSVYLLSIGMDYLLVDTGSFYHRTEIMACIERETDGDGIDAIILSHSDYPHAANVSEFRSEWEDVELIASSGSPEIQGLADARRSIIGESLDVLGRTFSFIDPPLADRSHTTWIYDHDSRVLFTADGFGSYHAPGECEYTSGEFHDRIAQSAIHDFHQDNLQWLRYVDPQKLHGALESIFTTYDVSYVAPIHGTPIRRSDLDTYMDRLIDAVDGIAAEYVVPDY